MTNQLISEIKTTKKEIRNFAIIVGLFILTVGAILFWKNNSVNSILFIIGFILLGTGLVIPMILKPIYFVWMVFAAILGRVMTLVILSLLFYAVFTPIGLVSRIFGKRFLELRPNKSKGSYWNYKNMKQLTREDYDRQF